MGEIDFCTINDLKNTIFSQLISDITTDVNIPIILVRLMHNKLFFAFYYSIRCYLLYIDTIQIARFVSPILFPFIIYGLFSKLWIKTIVGSFFLFPLFFIFNPLDLGLGEKILLFKGIYMFFSLVGFIKIVRLKLIK